jgi:hypothetical protein
MNCVACHSLGVPALAGKTLPTNEAHVLPKVPLPAKAGTPNSLASLSPDQGCLAEKQASGTPRFDLNDLQKRALKLALAVIQKEASTEADGAGEGGLADVAAELLRLP